MPPGLKLASDPLWDQWDTLFTIASSFVVSICGITNILTGLGFVLRGESIWSTGYFLAVGVRVLVSFYFFRKEEYESSWRYRLCTILQINFLLDALRCCGQKKYLSNFYWGKLLHSTLEATPLSFGTVYILLDGNVSDHMMRRQLGAVALSVLCISIAVSVCNHAPLYQIKYRKWGSFLLRLLELVTFSLSFGLFAHKFKVFAIPVIAAKYFGATGLIYYHNRKTGSVKDVLLFSGFAALLDVAIIWYSSSLPPPSDDNADVREENKQEAFLVEDGTVKSCSQSLLLSDVYIVTILAFAFAMSDIHDGFEANLLLAAVVSFISQHVIYLTLVFTHPRDSPHSKHADKVYFTPN